MLYLTFVIEKPEAVFGNTRGILYICRKDSMSAYGGRRRPGKIFLAMKRIGIISDTHSWWDDKYLQYFEECDEIWHAGDICGMDIIERLGAPFGTDSEGNPKTRIVRAVCGNCDGGDLRLAFPEILRWRCEGVEVMMKHIGGYPGRYDSSIVRQIHSNPPQLFISGHSHILKVMADKSLGLLHINPGAAGIQGWHVERTLVRLTIDGGQMKDLDVVTLGNRGTQV